MTTSISFPFSIMENSKNVKPVEVLRMRGVSVSIFANKVKDLSQPLYKVSVKRTYHKDGEFRSVTTFSPNDMPVASLLLQQAWVRVNELEQE